ncbi:uncharacterized protein YegP (UPF0339 family) [Sphingomonas leidyi]|uniref:Uncharacterized protein YegP (UPF0339 family) n=1 Tax=Sphingomonas leidyi TaxID=68569 RepID=A0A7X5UWL7_9SPHN|nr:DUF1508 domain-containing protein [Sphingomonas leidyi]NIJ63076.1 uncharacterized protein YegP (UPF0339 family) [Sphingomonas leidyi]
MSSSSAFREFEPPCRVSASLPLADIPVDVSDVLFRLTASNDTKLPSADPTGARANPAPEDQFCFEIYRAEEVRLTSILFSGGDWRWRFCSASDVTLATSAGYASERDCAAAVAALRSSAGCARVRTAGC